MRARMDPIQAAKSASIALASIRCRCKRFQHLALEHAHLLLRGVEALAALLRKFEAALVRRERLLKRQAAVFHARNDALEFRQGLLEARRRGSLFLLAHREPQP